MDGNERPVTIPLLTLALAAATAMMAITLGDHARLVGHQELAYAVAQHQAEQMTTDCAAGDCALPAGTRACRIGGSALQVTTEMPWQPQLWTGLTPAVGRYIVHLEIATNPLLATLNPCHA